MTATFTAIPVGQGDAFLLERADGTVVLVDGGRARSVFASQLTALHGTRAIDVVVCTHADADHAEGLVGLLEASFTAVREVWLPGRWAERLVELCARPMDFLSELFTDVTAKAAAAGLEPSDITRTTPDAEAVSTDAEEIDVDPEEIDAALGSEERLAPDVLEAVAGGAWTPWLPPFDTRQDVIVIEALQAVARIRKLVRAAHHHGAKIRWFDFKEAQQVGAPPGGEPFLRPVNAVELTTRVRRGKLRAIDFVRLTLANKQSLVFEAPEDEANSAVIFAADSDLTSMQPLTVTCTPIPTRTPIVTAPHHGAETNAAAYGIIASRLPCGLYPHWVRSDGNYRTRPGATYLGVPQKVCTLCRGCSRPKQRVDLIDSPSGWQLAPGVPPCACR